MSIGNATQAVNFDRDDLTLVLGENLDLGSNGSRNGTGKTTLINALSYVLYGAALSDIKVNNLVNKTNEKNMLVSLDFEKDGVEYRIERGRKPNILKFYVDGKDTNEDDNAQGDNRETQKTITEMLGISHSMFKHAIALNTYTTPFLSEKTAEQKAIIEELLGITVLTEKAEALKEINKKTKEQIKEEEFRLSAQIKANQHIEEQIESLELRQKAWKRKHNENIDELTSAIEGLLEIDIEQEIEAHKKNTEAKEEAKAKWYELNDIAAQKYNAEMKKYMEEKEKVTKHNANISKHNAEILDCNRWIEACENNIKDYAKQIQALEKDIKLIEDHKCHACGQDLHDEKQEENKKAKQELLKEAEEKVEAAKAQEEEYKLKLAELGEPLQKMDIPEAPVQETVDRIEPNLVKTFYDSIDEAHNHKYTLESLSKQLESANAEQDPYEEQIQDMRENGIQEINYDEINRLNELQEHQELLLKLLTDKNSFIRKKIIEQNLAYLNGRLTHYLREIGLPHQVRFMSDLSVEITDLGRDLDFDNLSRGERNRLILSLSWAFRDVCESLYSHINLLFVDELVDNGLDTNGVEAAIKIMKGMSRERGKSVWLVSHREELISRVHNTMKVVKEGGFTNYEAAEY